MTPFWRKTVKEGLAHRDVAARRLASELLGAHCFDVTEVAGLGSIVANELRGQEEMHADPVGPASIDLGERVVLPASHTWFEANGTGYDLREVTPGRHELRLFYTWKEGDRSLGPWFDPMAQGLVMGHLVDQGDGQFGVEVGESLHGHFVYGQGLDEVAIPGTTRGVAEAELFFCLAISAIISSPSAARIPLSPHKGVERQIRQQASKAPQPAASMIVLRPGEPQGRGGGGAGSATPKAYHFCRAFTRVRLGLVERVRAHWRGDPAYGIRIGGYEVRGQAARP